MPNVAHAFIRVFHSNIHDLLAVPDMLNILLYGYRGHVGSKPLYVKENIKHQYTEIQFETKWDAIQYVEYLWAVYGTNTLHSDDVPEWLSEYLLSDNQGKLSCIWYREANERSGFDVIGVINGKYPKRDTQLCLYAFDTVKIECLSKVQFDSSDWETSHNGDTVTWISRQYGTYRSYNPYYTYGDIEPLLSPTTPVQAFCIETDVSVNNPSFEYWELPEYLVDIELDIWRHARTVEFSWKGRIVRKFLRCITPYANDGWAEYSVDYWDNCVNPEWLAYKQEIGLEE